KVREWDLATGKRLREIAVGAEQEVYRGVFSPDGNWLICGSGGPLLLLYDLATGKAGRRVEIPEGRYGNPGLAISPASPTLAVGDESGTISLVELASGKLRRRLAGGHQGGINVLLFSRDGERLISGSADTTALLWDLTGRLHTPPKPLRAAELDACWSGLAGE